VGNKLQEVHNIQARNLRLLPATVIQGRNKLSRPLSTDYPLPRYQRTTASLLQHRTLNHSMALHKADMSHLRPDILYSLNSLSSLRYNNFHRCP